MDPLGHGAVYQKRTGVIAAPPKKKDREVGMSCGVIMRRLIGGKNALIPAWRASWRRGRIEFIFVKIFHVKVSTARTRVPLITSGYPSLEERGRRSGAFVSNFFDCPSLACMQLLMFRRGIIRTRFHWLWRV